MGLGWRAFLTSNRFRIVAGIDFASDLEKETTKRRVAGTNQGFPFRVGDGDAKTFGSASAKMRSMTDASVACCITRPNYL
jgi:hypothetical protein